MKFSAPFLALTHVGGTDGPVGDCSTLIFNLRITLLKCSVLAHSSAVFVTTLPFRVGGLLKFVSYRYSIFLFTESVV
jgi:hypothetical protein